MQAVKKYNVARVARNLEALNALNSNKTDKESLKHYTGWGGLREAIYTPEVYRKLKNLLSDEEIASIKQTLTNAYYTPPKLVGFIFKLLERLNRSFSTVLEPSIGHGVFIEQMPQAMRKQAQITAIEIDSASCKLVSRLYPEVKLHQTGFQDYQEEQRFDLIIGNPPYGREKLSDSSHLDISEIRIHHYFVAKCMRLLAQDGILAMVLPRYFMDNRKEHARAIIAGEGGSLLAAYRLPDNLFSDAKVTVDVVLLRKSQGGSDWVNTERHVMGCESVFLNRYWLQNPDHIIGDLSIIEAFGRVELTCKQKPNQDIYTQLEALLSEFPSKKPKTLNEIKTTIKERLGAIHQRINRLVGERDRLQSLQLKLVEQERLLANQFEI